MGGLLSLSCCGDGELLSEAAAGKRTLVLVHGLAACALQTKVDPGAYLGCSCPGSDATGWDLTWLSIEEIITGVQRFRNSLELRTCTRQLRDGTSVLSTENLKGVQVRPYPGLPGVMTLNPGEMVEVLYMQNLIKKLAPTFRVASFNYDWRRWGDPVFNEEMVSQFAVQIEREKARTGRPVSVLGHSLGTTVVAYFLSVLGAEWTRANVLEVMLVAPVLMGSPKQVSAYAHNPAATMASLHELPGPLEDFLRQCMVTAPSMCTLLPCTYGDCFPADHAFVKTPSRSYTAADMGAYVQELERRLPKGRVPTAGFRPLIEAQFARITPPAVPTHLIYGKHYDTPYQVTFASDDLLATPEVSATAPGDGTVTAASVEALYAHWKEAGAQVFLHAVGDKEAQEHLSMIKSDWMGQNVSRVLTDRFASG